jgi:hypothetical protein
VFLQPRKHGAAGLVSVHRLAIFDADGNVVNIISQLDILRHALLLLLAVSQHGHNIMRSTQHALCLPCCPQVRQPAGSATALAAPHEMHN